MSLQNWISVTQAFGVFIIAAAGCFVAYQQFRLAKQKLRFDLYKRRFEILNCFINSIVAALNQNQVDIFDAQTLELSVCVREARFLFDKKTFEHLNRVESEILSYRHETSTLHNQRPETWPDYQTFLEKHHQTAIFLLDNLTSLPSSLHEFLSIDDKLSFSREKSEEAKRIKLPEA